MTLLFGVVKSKRDRAIVRVAYTYVPRASAIGLLERTAVGRFHVFSMTANPEPYTF